MLMFTIEVNIYISISAWKALTSDGVNVVAFALEMSPMGLCHASFEVSKLCPLQNILGCLPATSWDSLQTLKVTKCRYFKWFTYTRLLAMSIQQ